MSDRVLVIVPTYNEVENVERILDRLRASVPAAHALVVDDGSPDGTGELAEKLAAADSRVHVLRRTAKAGLGPAYVAGFRWARERGYDVVVEMDADGSHAPEQLPELLAALGSADLVLGSRYVPGGAVADWPVHRLLLSRVGNRYTRWALRLPLSDATGGYRAARGELIDALPFDDVASQGYCFQVDWAWRAVRAGARVREVPITFTERAFGRSKMSGSIVREALVRVTVWGLQDRLADWLPGRVSRPVPARTRDRGR
jgi:dolichol-phosphate mannosyltransferase